MIQNIHSRSRILAVASGGGHWEQMMLLRDTLDRHEVSYATTVPSLIVTAGIKSGFTLPDCSRDDKIGSLRCLLRAFALVRRLRPDVIISTGAMPGLLCLAAGRLMGARTIWIDSVANVETLSMSGALARHVATSWLTQWEHLATPDGPHYQGALL